MRLESPVGLGSSWVLSMDLAYQVLSAEANTPRARPWLGRWMMLTYPGWVMRWGGRGQWPTHFKHKHNHTAVFTQSPSLVLLCGPLTWARTPEGFSDSQTQLSWYLAGHPSTAT